MNSITSRMPFYLSSVFAAGMLALGALSGCAEIDEPTILNVDVEPDTWSIDGLADDVQFTITADLVHFTDAINRVTASIEGTDLVFDLTKTEDIASGERWEHSENLTVWSEFSVGTYYIDITATDRAGHSVTADKAAEVVITED